MNQRTHDICYLLIPILLAAQITFAQTDTTAGQKKAKGLQPGYIVKREGHDTVYGLVKKRSMPGSSVEWVDFKLTEDGTRFYYRSDSITAFGYGSVVYRFFDHSDWSKLISKGDILLYEGSVTVHNTGAFVNAAGHATSMNSENNIPCYVFIKNGKVKYIDKHDTRLVSFQNEVVWLLKKEVVNDFSPFISDDPEVLAELLNVDFRFKLFPELIEKYNAHKRK